MAKKKSIAKNYIFNLIYQMLIVLLPLITTPYLSRVLGSNGIGIFSYTLSIVTFFILFGSLGVTLYGQRTIAYLGNDKEESTKKFFEIIIIRAVTLFISMGIFYISFGYGDYSFYYKLLLLEMLANVFDISWFFQGKEEFDKLVIRNLIVKLLCVILIFTCIKSEADLWIYFLIYVGADLLGNISMWLYLPKYLTKINVRTLKFKYHIRPMVLLFLPQIAIQIYTVLDKTMIGILTDNMAEVGFYEQAQKVIRAIILVLSSLQTVMNSRIALAYANNDTNEIKECMEKSINFVWFLGTAMFFGIIGVSSGLVSWYYGKGFGGVEPILIAIAPIVMVIGFSGIFGVQYLVQVDKTKEFTISVIVGAIINFILNLILIPIYDGMGAAIASIVAEIIIATIQYIYIKREISNLNFVNECWKPVVAGIVMFGVVKFLDMNMAKCIFSTIVQIGVGGVIYLLLLVCFKYKFMFGVINQVFSFFKGKVGNTFINNKK